jgi:aspartate aminotransferase-like enzyme
MAKKKTAGVPVVTAATMKAAFEAVREEGSTNMFDRTRVLGRMVRLGYTPEALWLEANMSSYGPMLMREDYSALEVGGEGEGGVEVKGF